MSVVLRCIKCSGVLEEHHKLSGAPEYVCPNCKVVVGAVPSPQKETTFEEKAISLLTEIRDELRKLGA